MIGREEGGRVACGGGRPDGIDDPFFYAPTVFTDVTNDMTICREEIFGPVLAIMPFTDEQQAVHLANDTRFGLCAAVWTSSLDRAHRVTDALRPGTVWVNHYRRGDPAFPNGGMAYSGYGRLNGFDGYLRMTLAKSVQIPAAAIRTWPGAIIAAHHVARAA